MAGKTDSGVQNTESSNISNESNQSTSQEMSSRRKSDIFFMFLLIFITVYQLTILMQFPDIIKTLEAYGVVFRIMNYKWLVPGFIFSHFIYFTLGKWTMRFWRPLLSAKNTRDNETEEQRVDRCQMYLMASIYYSTSFVFAYLVAKQENLVPVVYGGNLDFNYHLKIWPLGTSEMIQIVYLFSYGHHIERLVHYGVYSRNSATYYSMMLHHVITVGLIAISYQMEYCAYGVPVLLLLDVSDCLLHAARFLRETNYSISAKVTFVVMSIFWLHGRVIGFGYEVVLAVFDLCRKNSPFLLKYYGMHLYYFTGLFILWVLNVFWLYQILMIFVTVFWKKSTKLEYEDSYLKKQKSS